MITQQHQWHAENLKNLKGNEKKYPDKQTVLRVWDEGNPYSKALSSSSFVAVILRTGGEAGLGADTTSYWTTKTKVKIS